MKYSNYLFFLLCTLVTICYFIGVVFFLTDHEPGDKCEMTYMFEYPQYVRVSQKIDQKYPKYGLYAYGEGRMTKKARNMYFDGIPVLFIPGNAGSHQQVRSLSSVALRKTLNSGIPYHFDYFTVDLNSEFSALYGPVLYEQLQYVLSSIDRILELYKNSPSSPQQVVLIGHSVGGIIGKKVMTELLKSEKNLVSVLITLAAPIKRAPIYFDRQISAFYKTSSFDQENVTTVSIGGGYSDFLVPTYLTDIGGNKSINLVASNIPKAWVESNHVQILWCKQVVLAINRALFDSVNRQSVQISTDADFVRKVFTHHLIHNSGTQFHLKPGLQKVTKINYKGEWIESLYKQYTVEHKKGVKQPYWYMVHFTALPTYEMLTILAINLEVTDWIFVCNAAFPNGVNRVCVEAEHLTQYSEIVPTSRYKRRLFTINMHELQKNNTEYTHVVFRALPTSEPVTFHVDIYGSNERKIEISLPRFSLTKQVILSETPDKAVEYDIILSELENLLQVYQLFVEPIRCSSEQYHATASLILPWANENIHSHFTEAVNKPFIIRLQNSKPPNTGNAKVRLILEPTCSYKISVRLHILGVFGQIARYYSPFLITNIAVVFLLGLRRQISQMGKTGSVPIFFTALVDGLKQSWVIPVVLLISNVSPPSFMKILPQPELFNIENDRVMIIPIILFMVSIVTVVILFGAYCVSLFALESIVHKLVLKLLAKTVTFTIRFSDYFMMCLHKVPFIVAGVLIALCFITCGGLALFVGLIFYFLKLTQMSQDYVEQVAWFILKILVRKFRDAFSKNKNDSDKKSPVIEKNTISKNSQESLSEQNTVSKNFQESIPSDRDDKGNNGEPVKSVDGQSKVDNTKQNLNAEEHSKCSKSQHTAENNDGTIQEQSEITKSTMRPDQTTEPPNEQSWTEIGAEQSRETSNDKNSLFKNLSSSNNALFFHSSMFFMWIIITALNIPAVLTWAHNFKYSKSLIPDESFLPGLILSLSALPLWQLDFPRINRKYTSHLQATIICIILVSLSYATVSVYRLNYMLTILFALIIIQQCYAPKENAENEEDDTEEKLQKNIYDENKMKLD